MSFRLTEDMALFFADIDKSKIKGTTFLDIDKFYSCLMLGFKEGKFYNKAKLNDPFLAAGARWPEPYREYDNYILGLLIEAEIRRLEVDRKDRQEIEKTASRLLDSGRGNSLGLSEDGIKHMNYYAAQGFQIMVNKMNKPRSVEDFLVSYANLFWQNETE